MLDVVGYLRNYNNNDKLIDIIKKLKEENIDLTKTNILKAEKELFGIDTKLVFKDVVDENNQVLYTYDNVSEDYIENNSSAYKFRFNIYNKILQVEKSQEGCLVTVLGSDNNATGIYKSYFDALNRANIILDYKEINEVDLRTFDAQYEFIFNNEEVYEKLDKYQFIVTYSDGYVIKSYEKIE